MPKVTFNSWIDKSIYNLTTLQKVCYALSEQYTFEIGEYGEGYQLKATSDKAVTEQEFRTIINQLLLDYALREDIAKETSALKSEILRTVLSSVAKRQ